MKRILDLAMPPAADLDDLARRETDPAHVAEFAPIERGPLVAIFVLAWVGLVGSIAVPVQMIRNAFARRRAR